MKSFVRLCSILSTLFIVFLFVSCSDIIGYSVVLWAAPELSLKDGTVVPVYLKSNISKVYIISLPDSEEKVEIPLWKLSEPTNRKNAASLAETYSAFAGKYAVCVLDGLPIREEAKNTSHQVYRLRKGEVIRTLRRGEGEMPTNGTNVLEGEWLNVLASNGTKGWCFSHNLKLVAMNEDGTLPSDEEGEIQTADVILEKILNATWYPEYYASMIKKQQIDLNYMKTSYGFDTGSTSGTVALRLNDVDMSYSYNGITKSGSNTYKFNDTPLQMVIRNENLIVVKFTDKDNAPRSQNFITMTEDIRSVIASEQAKRNEVYNTLRSFGPVYTSSGYGTLTFTGNKSFSWKGYDALVPAVISADAKGEGTTEVKYAMPSNLKSSWDNIITFHFSGSGSEVNFLYKKEATGLRLTIANVVVQNDMATRRDNVTISQNSSAPVIFFHN